MSGQRIEDQHWTGTLDWDAVSRLGAVSAREGITTGHALHRAIAAYALLSEKCAAGATLILRKADGTEVELKGIGTKPGGPAAEDPS